MPNRIVQPINEEVRQVLPGYVAPEVNASNDRGAAPDSMPLEQLHLVLRRSASQEASLKQLIASQNTPGSPSYHKWLSPAEFGAQFGPSAQDIATVESWLSSHGFAVDGVEPGKQVLSFSGNVAELRQAFGVQIHRYQVNGGIHFAAANNPQIPAALAPVVEGFVSLNNFRPQLNDRVLGSATYNPKTDRATPNWTYGNASQGLSFVLSPGDFGKQYDLPASTAMQGQGESIAILDFSNINLDLVQQFRSLFGLPTANLPQVVIDGNDPGIDGVNNPDGPLPGSATESYLDVEWAGAIAPRATIYLVIAADTALENGGILAAEHAVDSDIAPIISSSIAVGGCEENAGAVNSFIDSLWEQAAAEGITVVVAAGDNGSAGCDNQNTQQYALKGLGVNSWASTPYDVAVGGTDFYYSDYATGAASISNYWSTSPTQQPGTSLLTRIPEQPWNDSQYGDDAVSYYDVNDATALIAGAGGASSAAVCSGNDYNSSGACQSTMTGYPKPAWQTGAGVPADSVRDIPDVSLFAADGYNYSFYPICAQDGDCQTPSGDGLYQITGVGGTSAAAPAFAAIMALVDQQYGPQGQADFVLYPLKKQFPASFHDVTVGTNSVPCTGSTDCIAVTSPIEGEGQIGTGSTPDYNAAAGYNLATGLGSVDASQLIADWNQVTFQSTQTTLSSPSAGGSYTHGSAITINGQVTGSVGSPGGAVAILSDSTAPLQQGLSALPLTSGAFNATTYTVPGGTYDLWAQYGGDGTNGPSTSSKVQITVNPESSTSYFNVVNVAARLAVNEPSGSSVPYGTQLMLDDQTFGSNYYTQCLVGGGTGPQCQHYEPPTGTLIFSDNGSTLNTAVLNAQGDAEYNAAFPVGNHSVTSSYAGDGSYQGSSGSAITFTVTQDTPAIILSAPSLLSGQASVITIQVENGANGSFEGTYGRYAAVPVAAPTGTVTVTGLPGGAQTVTLTPAVDPEYDFADGVATVTIPSTAGAGNYNITVSYSGDPNYTTASNNTAITLTSPTAGLLTSKTAASMTAGTISPNSNITVTGTVSGPSGDPAPSGGVYFYSSGNYLGAVAFSSSSGNVSNFTVALNSSVLFEGNNFITVEFPGDSNYNPSQVALNSGGINNPLSDFSIVPESATVPVTAGASNNDILQLYSVNGFAGTVNYTCTAAAGVICSLSPNSNTLTANSTTATTLTVEATSATPNGSYDVSVIGTDGEYVHSVGLTAMVTGSSSTGSPSIVLSNSGSINVTTGGTGTSTLTITPETGFTGEVVFTCSINGAPSGISCSAPSVDIASTTPATSTLTASAATTATPGTYTATVVASDAATGTITSQTPVQITVTQPPSPSFTLNNSGSINVTAGSSGISTLTVTPANGFTGGVNFSCTIAGSPSGLSCSAPAATVSGTSSVNSTLTALAASGAAAGTYTATVTASDQSTGSITSSVNVSITVAAAPPSPSFTLSNSGSISLAAGSSGTSTLTVTPANGFTGGVNFSCAIAGSPAGLSCSAPQATVSGAGSVTSALSASATLTAAAGTYMATVTATDAATGAITSSTSVSINVSAVPPSPSFTLSNSGNISLAAGSTGTSTLTVTPANGFTGTVNFSCAIAGSPAGLSCSVPAATVSGTHAVASTLTATAAASTTAGTYTATVTGTDAATGEVTSSTTLSIRVTAAPTFTLSNSGSISVAAGSSSGSTLTITPANGFTGGVSFSCSIDGSPAGVSCSAPATTVSGATAATSALTVTASNSAAAGSYTATVIAADTATGKITSSTTVPVTVTAANSPGIALSNSGNISVMTGSSGTSTLTVTPANGFTGGVNFTCAIAGSPAGLSCSAPQATVSGTAAATATLTAIASSSAAAGTYTATVTAADAATGTVTSSTTLTIAVIESPQPSFTLSNSGNISLAAGSTGTSTLTVAPANGFTGGVNFSCAIAGSPAGLSCSAPQATVSGAGSVTSALSVSAASTAAAGAYMATVTATDAATGAITSSTSVSINVSAVPLSPSFTLSNSGNISLAAGSTGTSTLTVAPANGFTGTVNFSCAIAGSPAGLSCSAPAATVSGAQAVASTLSVTASGSTNPGDYVATVTASDAATGTIASSVSLAITVSAAASFALSNSGMSAISAGGFGTSTVTVAPSNGFTGDVALTCSVSSPANGVSCGLSPETVDVTSGAVMSTLTVSTAATSAALRFPLRRLLTGAGGVSLALVFLFGIPARRRNWHSLLGLLIVVIALAGIGCGVKPGGTGSGHADYTVTVTGVSGSMTQSTAVTVTVDSQ